MEIWSRTSSLCASSLPATPPPPFAPPQHHSICLMIPENILQKSFFIPHRSNRTRIIYGLWGNLSVELCRGFEQSQLMIWKRPPSSVKIHRNVLTSHDFWWEFRRSLRALMNFFFDSPLKFSSKKKRKAASFLPTSLFVTLLVDLKEVGCYQITKLT